MPANVGTQKITLKWLTEAASHKINERFYETRPTGIYKGGYLSAVTSTTITISPLVCEIADVDFGYQIRAETTTTVTITDSVDNFVDKVIVLRWDYTASSTADYMALLAVAIGAVRSDDLIVGYCISASSFDYGRAGFYRSNPDTLEHFLRVEAPDSVAMSSSPLKVRVRAGRIQNAANINIPDQPTANAFSNVSGVTYGLVYIDNAGTAQRVDNTGQSSIPDYDGKRVIAEIKLPSDTAIITQSMIKDVRSFLTPNMLDEDDMASDSESSIASQQSIKVFVEDAIITASYAVEFDVISSKGDFTPSSILTLSAGTWMVECFLMSCDAGLISDRDITINGTKAGDFFGDSNHDGNSNGNGIAMAIVVLTESTGIVCTVSGIIRAQYSGLWSAKAVKISNDIS